MTDFVFDEPEFIEMPRRMRWDLTKYASVGIFTKLRALALGWSVYDVMKERCAIRFKQFGGEQMSDRCWGIYLNEMPAPDFINLILRSPADEEDEENEKQQMGFLEFNEPDEWEEEYV